MSINFSNYEKNFWAYYSSLCREEGARKSVRPIEAKTSISLGIDLEASHIFGTFFRRNFVRLLRNWNEVERVIAADILIDKKCMLMLKVFHREYADMTNRDDHRYSHFLYIKMVTVFIKKSPEI